MAQSKRTNPTGSSKAETSEVPFSEVMTYCLSDPTFIAEKWTKLPAVVPPTACLWTRPWSCFKKRETEKCLYYPKGQLAAKFETNGTGKIFYINGNTAIELSESITGYQKIRLFSDKKPNYETKCLGWLDSFGNGVICDLDDNIIANYDQTGGFVFNTEGSQKWLWNDFVNSDRIESVPTGFIRGSKTSSIALAIKKTSDRLLNLHLKNSPSAKMFKLQDGKIYFRCKISDCLSLWIWSQDKIDLSFSSRSFITRLDVGVNMADNESVPPRGQSILLSAFKKKDSNKTL